MQFLKWAARLFLSALDRVTGVTVYSTNHEIRKLVYKVRSRREALMVAGDREIYVIRGGDWLIGGELFRTGEFDFAKLEIALRLLALRSRVPRVLIDVGANIGSISIPAVHRELVDRAIAIEPEPTNLRLLKANVALNGCDDRIEVIAAAAGETKSQAELILASANFGDYRLVEAAARGYHTQVTVDVDTLDSLCADVDPAVALLWMDIQGHECRALAGAQRFLAARTPLVLELDPVMLGTSGGTRALHACLAHYDSIFDLNAPEPTARSIRDLGEVERGLLARGVATDLLII